MRGARSGLQLTSVHGAETVISPVDRFRPSGVKLGHSARWFHISISVLPVRPVCDDRSEGAAASSFKLGASRAKGGAGGKKWRKEFRSCERKTEKLEMERQRVGG